MVCFVWSEETSATACSCLEKNAMSSTIELPHPLDKKLAQEAEREGVSATEHATLLLYVVTALLMEQNSTPFQEAVRNFFVHRSLDAEEVASAVEELVRFCIESPTGKGKTAAALQAALGNGLDLSDFAALRAWRDSVVHLPQVVEQPVDVNLDAVLTDVPPIEEISQEPGRLQRPSARETAPELKRDPERVARVRRARGKFAHTATGLASDELHEERQRDKEKEERRIQGYRP